MKLEGKSDSCVGTMLCGFDLRRISVGGPGVGVLRLRLRLRLRFVGADHITYRHGVLSTHEYQVQGYDFIVLSDLRYGGLGLE